MRERATLLLVGLVLAWAPSVGGQTVVQGAHNQVTHDGFPTEGATMSAALDQAWPVLVAFFTPLGLSSLGPVDVTINAGLASDNGEAWGYTYPDGIRIEVNPGSPNLEATAAHELFHAFLLQSGFDPRVAEWMQGGASDMAEHLVWPAKAHKLTRMENYQYIDERHHQSIFDAGHHAQLFLYYLHHEVSQNFIQGMLETYQATGDDREAARLLGLDDKFREFVKGMWNGPAQPAVWRIGETGFTADRPQRKVLELGDADSIPLEVDLPPLSFYVYRVVGFEEVDDPDVSVYLDELAEHPDVFVHTFRRERGDTTYQYEDWTGQTHYRFCLKDEGVCKGEQKEQVSDLWLFLGNSSLDATHQIKGLVAAGLAPTWRVTKVQVSQDTIAPTRGELTLEFGSNGGTLVRSQGWWIVMPESHFVGQSRLAYTWVNRRCRMKGFVKMQRSDEKASYDQTAPGARYEWRTTRVERGEFYTNPTHFACSFVREQLAASVGGPALAAVVARVFTDLNTREYPPDSFASELSNVMIAVMTLMVPPAGSGPLEMLLERPSTGQPTLRVEIEGNIRAFFEPVYE